MAEQIVNAKSKIDYVKPVLLDLGAVTAAYGAAGCNPNGTTATLECNTVGGTAGTDCMYGNTARNGQCLEGDNALT